MLGAGQEVGKSLWYLLSKGHVAGCSTRDARVAMLQSQLKPRPSRLDWWVFAMQRCCNGKWAECWLQDAGFLVHSASARLYAQAWGGEPSLRLEYDVDLSCLMARDQWNPVPIWPPFDLLWSYHAKLSAQKADCLLLIACVNFILGIPDQLLPRSSCNNRESLACRSN